MTQTIAKINGIIGDFVWGVPAMILIMGVGLLLTIRTRGLQIRRFGYSMRMTLGKVFSREQADKGAVTPFQAVCTALAATVGTGNIAGVAGADCDRRARARCSGCGCRRILGMCTKYAEVTLAVHFREKNRPRRLGGRPDVLHQKRPGAEVYSGWPCCFRCVRRAGAASASGNATQVSTIRSARSHTALSGYGVMASGEQYLVLNLVGGRGADGAGASPWFSWAASSAWAA